MPQYRFRVEDKDGRVRTGKTTAADRAEALGRIEQSGLKVLELVETLDSGSAPSLQVHKSGKSTYRATRAEPYELDELWSEKLARLIPSGFNGNLVFGVLAVVGLVVAGLSYKHEKSKAKPKVELPKIPISVTVSGDVSVAGIQDLGDVRVSVDFPDVPYQLTKRWSDLERPSKGRFIWKIDFVSTVQPRTCVIRANKPDYDEVRTEPFAVKEGKGNYKVSLSLQKSKSRPPAMPALPPSAPVTPTR